MAQIIGTPRDDDLVGSPTGQDDVFGLAGNDRIDGQSGDDRLFGGPGDDQLLGNLGDDLLFGEDDDDLLRGGPGDDQLFGGNGGDVLLGDNGDDLLAGDRGDDDLLGGAGDDRLAGGAGDDNLFGDAGDDVLDGGPGLDRYLGGADADRFELSDLDGNVNEILDFHLAEGDRLDVSALGQAALSAGATLNQVMSLETTPAGTLVAIDPDGGGGFQPVALLRGVQIEQLTDQQLGLDPLTPVANDDSASTDQTTPITVALLANDQGLDPDDPLRILALDTAGTAGSAVINPGDTTVTYTPDPGFFGIDSFDYTVIDQRGGTDQAEVRVGVLGSLSPAALDGVNGFVLEGVDPGDASGSAVADAGDVNGDGFDDLLIGAPGAGSKDLIGTGEAYVIFGQPSGFDAQVALAALNGTNGFLIEGVAAAPYVGGGGAALGASVHRAGDVNGDGLGDIIVGAPGASDFYDRNGQSFVIFGNSAGFGARFDPDSLDGTNGFRLDDRTGSEVTSSYSGQSVSGGGDMNGDGFADMIVDSPEISPLVHVIFGAQGGFPAVRDLDGSLDGVIGFTVSADDVIDDGVRVPASHAGDINGDGLDDLLLGFPSRESGPPDETVVVFGSEAGLPGNITPAELDGQNGFLIQGFGSISDVSDAGDVNGDGLSDFIIGERYGAAHSAGASYVVFGSSDGFPVTSDIGDLDGMNGFRIDGLDRLGGVSGAGDVDGDGFDDVIVGGRDLDQTGQAFVIFGQASGFAPSVDIDDTNGFRIDGVGSGSSAGDLNGDGFADVLVGAPGADPNGRADAGASYVVFGGDLTASVDLLGTVGGDSLTGTAADEIVVGAQGDDVLLGGGGSDILNGGAGDDLLAIGDVGFRKLIGGGGADTVRLDGTGETLDLTAISDLFVQDVERVDLNGNGNQLVLDTREILNIDDNSNRLTVFGDDTNAVSGELPGATQGSATVGGVDFSIFMVGQAQLLVQTGVDTSGIETAAA